LRLSGDYSGKNIAASDFDNRHKIYSIACVGINNSHRNTQR
jgi:hypothetical protein